MNTQFYKNYVTVVESGTLSAASKRLHIAQSALSTQIKQFESEYGVPLFTRNSRRMELTDAGKIVYKKARSMLAILDSSFKEVNACKEGYVGTLKLGIPPFMSDNKIANLLLEFQTENENVSYDIYEKGSHEILDLLRSGVIEIGILDSSLTSVGFQEHMVINQRLCVYCGYNNPWLSPYDSAIDIASMDKIPVSILRSSFDTVREAFDRSGVVSSLMSTSASMGLPMVFAKNNRSVAVVFIDEHEKIEDANAFCRPLVSSNPEVTRLLSSTRSLITLKESTLSSTAQRFIEFVKSRNTF